MVTRNKHSNIDRYISGRMDAQERTRFEELLRNDDALRATYETDRAIEQALLKDKASIPANHASLEANVMKTLASVSTSNIAPLTGTGSGAMTGSTLLTSTVLKTVISIVAGLGILTGIMWYANSGSPDAKNLDSGSQPTIQLKSPATPSPTAQESESTIAPPPTPARDPEFKPDRPAAFAREATHQRATSNRTPDEIYTKRSSQTSTGATVITPDSVQIKLKLDVNKPRRQE